MPNPLTYTIRWMDGDGERQEEAGRTPSLSNLAEHLADEVRSILLSGGGEISIERSKS